MATDQRAKAAAEKIHEYVCLRLAKIAGSPHYDRYDFIAIIQSALDDQVAESNQAAVVRALEGVFAKMDDARKLDGGLTFPIIRDIIDTAIQEAKSD